MRVTVAVCTKDHPQELRRCLRALEPLRAQAVQILVVDNDSRGDETRRAAREHGVDYALERRPGLAAARNRAIACAIGDVLAFTDDDCEPDLGWISAIRGALADETLAGVTGRAVSPPGANDVQREFDYFARGFCVDAPRVVSRTDTERVLYGGVCGVGANMAFRRCALLAIGGFVDSGPTDEEDDIALIRLLRAGYRLRYEPRSLVYQHHRARARDNVRRFFQYGAGSMRVARFFAAEARSPALLARNGASLFLGGASSTYRSLRDRHWLSAAFGAAQVAGLGAGLFGRVR